MTRIEEEDHNKRVVKDLYKALNSKDKETLLHQLLAQDLEWWFHGPPCHSHNLIHSLTSSSSNHFNFVPNTIVRFGSLVIAEGYDEANMVWWVHAWTFNDDGVISQIREYVNTSVTLTRLCGKISPSLSSKKKVGSLGFVASSNCLSIWKSKLSCDESVPGVILTI